MPASELYEDRKIREAEARGDHAEAALWRRIRAVVDEAPPLGPCQKALLRSLLSQPSGPAQRQPAA